MLHSRFVHRDLHEIRVAPAQHGKWTLVFRHGRDSGPAHYAHEIHAQLHVWPGGHDSGYWHAHMRQYLAFYARHCA